MRNRVINISLVSIAYILTCVAVFTSQYFQSAMAVEVGDMVLERIVATRDVVNPVQTELNRTQARINADNLPPIVAAPIDHSLTVVTINNIHSFFERLNEIRVEYDVWHTVREDAYLRARSAWQQEVDEWERQSVQAQQMADENGEILPMPPQPRPEFYFELEEFPLAEQLGVSISAQLTPTLQEFLFDLTENEQETLQYILVEIAEEILEEPGILDVLSPLVAENVHAKLLEITHHNDLITVGHVIIMDSLVPNRVFDADLFALLQQEMAENYERVIVEERQMIVDANHRIDEEAYAIMRELGMLESEWTSRDLIPLIGVFIIVAITMFACCWFIIIYRKRVISRTKEMLLLFTLYTVVLMVLWALDGIGFYFMPILIFTMLTAMLIDTRTAAILNLGFTVIAYFVVDGTMQYTVFFVLSGTVICLLSKFTTERNKIMMVSLLVAFVNFALTVAISLAFEPHLAVYNINSIIMIGFFAALNGVLTVIVAVGSLPLWEVVFGVVTPIKILDLTNPTNPLMRRLTIEAPGTYHHSLIVANLAETAAYDIGANPHIARAGGYYHDIGKLKYPGFFAENITGPSPHDEMEPSASAKIIMSHIDHGLALAQEYRLPQFLRDIIHEHHATTIVKYFYSKAKEYEEPEKPLTQVNEEDYRYPFSIPQSRESAIVMLADGIEAAVRAVMLKGKDITDMQGMVNKMVKDKLMDGSLAESNLSIKDVDTIAKSFYRVLKGMYHERIPYPQDADRSGVEVEVAIKRR